jgi:hypothetical protein
MSPTLIERKVTQFCIAMPLGSIKGRCRKRRPRGPFPAPFAGGESRAETGVGRDPRLCRDRRRKGGGRARRDRRAERFRHQRAALRGHRGRAAASLGPGITAVIADHGVQPDCTNLSGVIPGSRTRLRRSKAQSGYSGMPALRSPSLIRSFSCWYFLLVSASGTGEKRRKVDTLVSGRLCR